MIKIIKDTDLVCTVKCVDFVRNIEVTQTKYPKRLDLWGEPVLFIANMNLSDKERVAEFYNSIGKAIRVMEVMRTRAGTNDKRTFKEYAANSGMETG